jgi:hypothetical protein
VSVPDEDYGFSARPRLPHVGQITLALVDPPLRSRATDPTLIWPNPGEATSKPAIITSPPRGRRPPTRTHGLHDQKCGPASDVGEGAVVGVDLDPGRPEVDLPAAAGGSAPEGGTG